MKQKYKHFLIILIAYLSAQEPDSTMSMSGGVGSITLDGQIYNQISFSPEIPIGKLGVAFDFYLNIDSEGNLHTGDWKFNDFESGARTLIDKIRYVRWGKPSDPFYARFGNLYDVHLGMGILVHGYTNALQYPSIRKLGMDVKADFGTLGLELMTSDFKYKPGMTGARLSYKILPGLDLGISMAQDMDQNAGLTDRDGDTYPDLFDHFPDDGEKWDEAQEQIAEWNQYYISIGAPAGDEFDAWFSDLPLNHNYYDPIHAETNPVSGYAIDLSYRLPSQMLLYSQAAKLNAQHSDSTHFEGGIGFVPIGLKYNFGPAALQAEYRYNSDYFLYNYWDRSYEINRVLVNGEVLNTKEDKIFNYGKMNGIFAQLQVRLGNILLLTSNYTDMQGEVRENVDKDFTPSEANKSFSSTLALKPNIIPKLKRAELFYQQTNIPNPFAFEITETTVYGYYLEVQISPGMTLVYKSTTSFLMSEDDESSDLTREIELADNEGISTKNSTIQLETRFSF